MMNSKKHISFDAALLKLQKYCAFQERCTFEVKEKLNDFLLKENDKEQILSQLRKDGFLNDERFAASFVHGKFHFKKWGRIKIKSELWQKNISEEMIQQALKLISEEDYQKALTDLAQHKIVTLKKDKLKPIDIKAKTMRYLVGKGYEYDLIYSAIKLLIN